jgi:hypothetical protein
MTSLLLDEMFSGLIAERLCAKGHDVIAVVTDAALLFPQNRAFTAAVTSALSAILDQPAQIQPGQVVFLTRR